MGALIIGCGNIDRGDDAAGLLVARRLRAMGIPAQEFSGDAASLMERWAGADAVILIDAATCDAPAGAVSVWRANDEPLRPAISSTSTHGFGVAEAIELARALNRLPRSLLVYCIAGANFAMGSAPSPAVLSAVEKTAQDVAASRLIP